MKHHEAGPIKICLPVAFSALLALGTLLLLNACTISITPHPFARHSGASQTGGGAVNTTAIPAGTTITQSAGVAFYDERALQTLETYPIDEIASTRQLTDGNAVNSLSAAYAGNVRLEFALVYAGTEEDPNLWQLVYTADTLPFQNPIVWTEYLLVRVQPAGSEATKHESTKILLGPPYGIVDPLPLSSTASGDAQPTDLAAWVDALISATNSSSTEIARLLFSVEANGQTRRVLYLSERKEDGTFDAPDLVNVCQTDREGRIYCVIVNWLTGS